MRSLLSGGGTAGHIYPALAVAEALLAEEPPAERAPTGTPSTERTSAEKARAGERNELLFVGTPDGLEARLVPAAGVRFVGLLARGFDRAKPWTILTSSFVIALSTVRAFRLLGQFRPHVVIGFGGYVSIPVGLAAALRRIPLVLHEQNSVPGLANKLLSRWAQTVAITYDRSRDGLRHPRRAVLTGNPVRPDVLSSERDAGRAMFGVGSDELVLLAFGGSRGARHLNTALVAACDRLMSVPGLRVVHIAGREEADAVRESLAKALATVPPKALAETGRPPRWVVLDYVEEMGTAIAAADLVLARAGATSLAEITALGRAAVLVPYPYATDDHQALNASALVSEGAAELVLDSELDTERFGDVLVRLLSDHKARDSMAAAAKRLAKPDAARRVAEIARQAAAMTSAGRSSARSSRT